MIKSNRAIRATALPQSCYRRRALYLDAKKTRKLRDERSAAVLRDLWDLRLCASRDRRTEKPSRCPVQRGFAQIFTSRIQIFAQGSAASNENIHKNCVLAHI